MAMYHKNLQYHEDTVEKRQITKEDLEFLKELQKEMNTQDHCGNASPRFWVIKGSERECGVAEGYEDGFFIACDGDEVFSNIEEAFEYFEEEIDKIAKVEYIDEENKKAGFYLYKEEDDDEWDFEITSVEDALDWLETYDSPVAYELVRYRNIEKIYSDTMFITQKAAEEHLKINAHNYSADAHTYCMTAVRSPEVEKMYEIIQTIDWNKVKER